jgi:hypothetical protein
MHETSAGSFSQALPCLRSADSFAVTAELEKARLPPTPLLLLARISCARWDVSGPSSAAAQAPAATAAAALPVNSARPAATAAAAASANGTPSSSFSS